MSNFKVKWGESKDISVESDTAESARIIIKKENEAPIVDRESSFVDKVADLSLTTTDTEQALGDYLVQINVYYAGGRVKKYPSVEAGDCETDTDTSDTGDFFVLTICPSLDEEGTS